MTRHALTFILLFVTLASCRLALANDTEASIALGGLVLKQNDVIAMRSEDLYISREQVRVRYQFANTSDKDVTITVAFPLPDIGWTPPDLRVEDENFEYIISPYYRYATPTVDFHTYVDGQPIVAQAQWKAVVGDKDVTDWFQARELSISPDEVEFSKLSAADRKDARRKGIFDGKNHPAWVMQTTYYWQQKFPAGATLNIEHVYQPSTGGTVVSLMGDTMEYAKIEPGKTTSVGDSYKSYCVDQSLRDTVKRHAQNDQYYGEYWIDYILTTGANWKEPIADFRLVVDKGDPKNLISFCGDDIKKISPTQFEMRKTNWRPEKDLSVLILVPHFD